MDNKQLTPKELIAQLESVQGIIAGYADRIDDLFEKGVCHTHIGDLYRAIKVIERYSDMIHSIPKTTNNGE